MLELTVGLGVGILIKMGKMFNIWIVHIFPTLLSIEYASSDSVIIVRNHGFNL